MKSDDGDDDGLTIGSRSEIQNAAAIAVSDTSAIVAFAADSSANSIVIDVADVAAANS